jgi:hypothetical protein
MASYTLKINNVDRTKNVVNRSLKITDSSDSAPSTASFNLEIRDGLSIPSCDEEILITDQDSVVIFGGQILKITPKRVVMGAIIWVVSCVDWNRSLDRQLVVESYENMTDKEIFEDIVNNYCNGESFTTNNVVEAVTISQIVFNYVSPSQCFDKICELTGRTWYVDYLKDIHYIDPSTNNAPFDITDASANYKNLNISKDNSGLRNRVYVRGGSKLSDATTIGMKADGTQTVFNLPDKPHDFSMTVGGVAKTVGIKNIDAPADFDYLLNYAEKYVECGNDSAPVADTAMAFTYKYDIPILVALEDTASIIKYGMFEYAIFDNDITTTEQARDRASAELSAYAETIESGNFVTTTPGFMAGQTINIDVTDMDVDEDFIIKSVVANSMGGGNFEYTVNVASANILGIIKFLIGLIESNKNALNISSDEVVDELNTVATANITLTAGTPTLTAHSGTYKYDDGEQWDIGEWS